MGELFVENQKIFIVNFFGCIGKAPTLTIAVGVYALSESVTFHYISKGTFVHSKVPLFSSRRHEIKGSLKSFVKV